MTVNDRITPPVPNLDLDRSGMAAFFTGRGDTSTPHGLIAAHIPNPAPEPAMIATLPIGRQLLAATTAEDFHTALAAFADVWRAAGFGDATTDHTDPPPAVGTCAPPGGDRFGQFALPAYAFDGDQVFWYQTNRSHSVPNRGSWHTVTLTTTDEGTAVDLVPATRLHGESAAAAETALPHGTAVVGAGESVVVKPDFGAGGVDGDGEAGLRRDHRGGVGGEAGEVGHEPHSQLRQVQGLGVEVGAHNWTNPHDNADRRFTLLLSDTPRDDQIPELRERGRGPGTISVLAEPHVLWT